MVDATPVVVNQEVAKQQLFEDWLTRTLPNDGIIDCKDWSKPVNEKVKVVHKKVPDDDAESDDSTVTLTDGRKERHQPRGHFLMPTVNGNFFFECSLLDSTTQISDTMGEKMEFVATRTTMCSL